MASATGLIEVTVLHGLPRYTAEQIILWKTAVAKVIPLVLSGGAGTRLWPLSRELFPKQLIGVVGERTMLQETVLRTAAIPEIDAPMVVCNHEHRFMVAEQLRQVKRPASTILLEPTGRNTAPAIALGALQAMRFAAAAPVLLVLPADHVIRDVAAFVAVANDAIEAACAGHLVTFGVVPTHAETGYGYIEAGEAIDGGAGRRVARFVEKPNAKVAAEYVASQRYFWNSGMFVFRADRYLEELRKFRPDILTACEAAVAKAKSDLDFMRVEGESFAACPSESIDYAVMEKTDRAVVFPLAAGWNDVGSWDAVHREGQADERGNVTVGDVLLDDVSSSYVRGSKRLIAAIGVENLVIVDTPDALLVADKSKVQGVKNIVAALKEKCRSEATIHRRVFRPWGDYEGIDEGNRFQVKRITVKPGQRLSLQKHFHRAEHWIVVNGTAKVTRDGEEFLLTENQSTYIPLGATHRLENPGKVDLEMIEVQSGSYLGEDDIVRFDDVYGRGGT